MLRGRSLRRVRTGELPRRKARGALIENQAQGLVGKEGTLLYGLGRDSSLALTASLLVVTFHRVADLVERERERPR